MSGCIAVFNAGSSSLKFALYDAATLEPLHAGMVDKIPTQPVLKLDKGDPRPLTEPGHKAALRAVLGWLDAHDDALALRAVSHRVVHGGERAGPAKLDAALLKELRGLETLAPLHQPHNIAVMDALAESHPALPQVACFDTSFHAGQPSLARRFALPRALHDAGVMRYGFHGLSYEYIASVLPQHSKRAQGRVVVAHLGNGASLCALRGLKSEATSMGFSTLDGLMMGTRCGALDAGVVLHLLRGGMSAQQVESLLMKDSGLKGVSGISHDMRELLASGSPDAAEAVALYCRMAAQQIAGMAALLGGLDVLVFTAGIGQHAAPVRSAICGHLGWMGVKLDERAKGPVLHAAESGVEIHAIATNEELMAARHAKELLGL